MKSRVGQTWRFVDDRNALYLVVRSVQDHGPTRREYTRHDIVDLTTGQTTYYSEYSCRPWLSSNSWIRVA